MSFLTDWIDLPTGNFAQILGYESPKVSQLTELVQHYHAMAKDSKELLLDRAASLRGIVQHLTDWLEYELTPIDKAKHLVFARDIAGKKAAYLEALSLLYQEGLDDLTAVEAKLTSMAKLRDKSLQPIALGNHRYFSLKMREYWGDFWYEALDPCHRRLSSFLMQWEALKANGKVPHFFLWMETQPVPKWTPRVRYLVCRERELCGLEVQKGKIYCKTADGLELAHFCSPGERYLFVIDLKKRWMGGLESTGLSHSSFTGGMPVLGAGLLKIDQGQIIALSLESGPYIPTPATGYQILMLLLEMGVELPPVLQVDYFYDRDKYSASVEAHHLASPERFFARLDDARLDSSTRCHALSR